MLSPAYVLKAFIYVTENDKDAILSCLRNARSSFLEAATERILTTCVSCGALTMNTLSRVFSLRRFESEPIFGMLAKSLQQ